MGTAWIPLEFAFVPNTSLKFVLVSRGNKKLIVLLLHMFSAAHLKTGKVHTEPRVHQRKIRISLTPWSRIRPEKLIFKKPPAFYGTHRFVTVFTRARQFRRSFVICRKKLVSYSGDLSAPHLTPKLENHPLSAVCDCLFYISAATLHI